MKAAPPRSCWDVLLPALTVAACIDEFAFLAFPGLWHGVVWHVMLAFFVSSSLAVLIATPVCSRRGLIRPQAMPQRGDVDEGA